MSDGEDIIGDFFNQVRAVLGIDPFPPHAAQAIEQRMRATWGGERAYIRKLECEIRSEAIRREFNGKNRHELQAKYGISKGQFYRDLKGG